MSISAATGKPAPMKGTFHGFKTFEVHRTSQIVLHGPVLYVDDPYRCIAEAEPGWAQICSMIFVKSREYSTQKEYRFAMLSIGPETGEVFDLPVSGMLRDCLLPVKSPLGVANSPVTMAKDKRDPGEQRETSRGYTYQRRRVRRESGNWKDGEPGSGRAREEIVEETVTSPEEVPEPFPKEAKQPDIIMFELAGGRVRFAPRGLPKRRNRTLAHRGRFVKIRRSSKIPVLAVCRRHSKYRRRTGSRRWTNR